MRVFAAVVVAVIFIYLWTACGRDDSAQSSAVPRAARAQTGVQTWPGSATLQANKTIVANAIRAAGGDDCQVALIVAAAMAETQELKAGERDASKDGQGDAKNYSAFNMNAFALKKLQWSEGQAPDLNKEEGLAEAARYFKRGIDTLGEERFLCLHRGGQSAFEDLKSFGAQEYVRAIKSIQSFLMADKARFTDANRYGMEIQHV